MASGKVGERLVGGVGAAALVAASVLSLVPMARAQPAPNGQSTPKTLETTPPVPPALVGKQNAALLYFQLQDVVSRENWQELEDLYGGLGGGEVADADSRKALGEQRAFFEKLIAATKVSECEWGIQYQDGFGALLPQLGILRRYARMLSFDARRCLAEGDIKGLAERYEAIFRMSIHASRGGCLICSLVGEAIQALACVQVQSMLDAGQLTPEAARQILNTARASVGEDTHNYLGSLSNEEFMAVDWVKEHYVGPDAGEKLLTDLSGFNDEEVPGEDVVSKMDGATLSREVEKTRAYYTKVREAWNEADAAEKLKALSADVEAGKFGKVTLAIGAFDKAHRSMSRGKEQLTTTIKNLELFVRGEYVKPADKAVEVKGGAKPAGAKPVGAK